MKKYYKFGTLFLEGKIVNINIISAGCSELGNSKIFEKLRNRNRNLKHIVVAPDRSLFSLERRLFDELEEDCFFDLDVMSITRLSKRILSNINTPNILTKQSGIALVKRLLLEHKEELNSFGISVQHLGFATELFETICLYKSCNITPDEVCVDDSLSYANLKQKDIKLIYSEYEKYLQKDYTDSFNQLKVFANNIDAKFCKDTVFYFVEFDDYTALVYEIIAKLARYSPAFYITCCYSNFNNSNVYTNKVYGDLVTLFKSNGLSYSIEKINDFGDSEKDILLHNALAFNPIEYNKEFEKISIKSFDSMQDEIKYTIAHIFQSVIKYKNSFSDYSIVVPSIDDYISPLKRELSLYNIPVYFDRSELLINHALVRMIFDICNLMSDDFRLYDLLSVIKSPLLDFDQKSTLNIDILLKRIGDIGPSLLNVDFIDDDISQFITIIKQCRELVNNSNTYLDFHSNIVQVVLNYVHNRIGNYLAKLDEVQTRLYNQVINKMQSIDNDFLSVFGDNIDTFDRFVEIYKSYYETSNLSLPPISSNTLLIADFNNSYIGQTPYLYILGCNEGRLPKFQLDNGLVTDDEINALANGDKINPTISMLNKRKTFKLFDALFRFQKHLFLSYTQVGSDGKLFPNQLINSISKIQNIIMQNDHSSDLDTIENSYRQMDIDNIVFNNLTPKIAKNHLVDYSRNWQVYHESKPYRELMSTLYSLDESIKKVFINIVEPTRLDNITMLRNNMTSVSQIECYYNCPYKHFVRYGLHLKESLGDVLLPNDIGTIIHEVLSRIVPYIVEGNELNKIFEKSEEHLISIINREDYEKLLNNPKNTFIIRSLKNELKRICSAIYETVNNSNFVPKYYEYKFGKNDLVISGVGIKGSIDRVDLSDDNFIIIDYKTGDNEFNNYSDVCSGKKLQLLVYARAFEMKTKKNNVGVFYMPVSNSFSNNDNNSYKYRGVMINNTANFIGMDSRLALSNYKSNIINLSTNTDGSFSKNNFYKYMCLSASDYKFLVDFAIEKVKKAIIHIQQGEIAPYPIRESNNSSYSACKYCDYIAICGFQQNHYNWVKTVPNIDALKEIKDGGI